MAKLDEKYQKQLNKVLEFVEKMDAAGVFPINDPVSGEEYGKDALVRQVEELQKKKFTIATCGTVKAGKSTFLNDLLFGKDVLPYSDVPCTAKLTFISHTDGVPYFEAFYYTKEEFDTIRNSLKHENAEACKELEKRIDRSIQNGVSFSEIKGTSFKSHSTKKLDALFKELEEFVADDGIKTPFVKEVHIYINRPELANIDIVDTPGLNDPNPLNSLETIKYANQAHALIYLMGWKGLDEHDKNFLSDSFGMEKSDGVSNRIFIISHIDENPEWVDAKKDFLTRFPKEKIYGVSPYISLLMKKRDAGYTLTEDQLFELENLENSDFDPDGDHVSEKISDFLYKKEGEIRVHRVKEIMARCLKWKIDSIKKELNRLNKSIEDGEKSATALEKELEKIQQVQINLKKKMDECVKKINDRFSKWNLENVIFFENRFKAASETVCRRIATYNGVKISVVKFPTDVSEVFCSIRGALVPKLQELDSVYESSYEDIKKEIKLLYCETSAEEILTIPDTTSFASYFKQKIYEIGLAKDVSLDIREKISYFRLDATNNGTLECVAKKIIGANSDNVKLMIDGIVIKLQDAIKKFAGKLNEEINHARLDKQLKLEMDNGERRKKMNKEKVDQEKIKTEILPMLERLHGDLTESTVMGG